jgi:hypothetical protein
VYFTLKQLVLYSTFQEHSSFTHSDTKMKSFALELLGGGTQIVISLTEPLPPQCLVVPIPHSQVLGT